MQIKRNLIVLLLAFVMLSATGCQNKGNNKQTITVVDMLGESVEIIKNPTKVACVSRTTYDLLVSFGLGDKIDGAYDKIYDNAWIETIYPGSANDYRYEYEESYETFITRGVDLVFAPEKYIADGLKEHNIPALNISLYGNPNFDEYVYFFADLVKQIWDDKEVARKADAWKEKVKDALDEVTSELEKHELPKKKLMYVRGDKNKGICYTDSSSSFTEYVFRTLGFEFAGDTLATTKPSKEALMDFSPDVFVIGGIYQHELVDELKNDEVFKNLDSVKNDAIITIPVGLTMFEQLSVMTPVFIYDMANKLYHEYFDYDIASMVKETINESFGKEISSQEVEYMLQGRDNLGNFLGK